MQGTITIDDIKGIVRRRRKVFLIISTIIFLTSIIIALVLPPIYSSMAMLLIEEQKIPDEYVKSTINTYAIERIDTITRQIMHYSQLKSIINEFNLYPELTNNSEYGEAVRKMKKAISLEPVSSMVASKLTKSDTASIAFTLKYEGYEPYTVQQVTKRLASLYVEEESRSKEQLVSATTAFLEAELEKLKSQLAIYDTKISQFKARHVGELPENSGANLQAISRLERDLDSIEARIRTLQDRKIYLKAQLATVDPLSPITNAYGKTLQNPKEQLKALRLELIAAQSRLSEKHPDIKKLKAEISELEKQVGDPSDEALDMMKRLAQLNTKYSELMGRYGSKHPDVLQTKKEIDVLRSKVEALKPLDTKKDVSELQADNPAYINLMAQINSADTEIEGLLREKRDVELDLGSYQRKIEAIPLVEREYNELTLDYNNAKNRYNEIQGKLLEARFAQEMEEKQQGERFLITEEPYLPSNPDKPNRFAILLLGFVLSIGVSTVTAAVQEGTDHSIKGSDILKEVIGIPVLSELSYIETQEEKKQKRMRNAILALSSLGIILSVIVIINSFVIPLGDLWLIVLERMSL